MQNGIISTTEKVTFISVAFVFFSSLNICRFCYRTTHTHTHPFNGPFSRTTQVSRYQKGKTNLDFTEARDSEWQWHQLGHMQVCTSLQTDNHASAPPLSFLQAGCPSCRPTNSVKALEELVTEPINSKMLGTYGISCHSCLLLPEEAQAPQTVADPTYLSAFITWLSDLSQWFNHYDITINNIVGIIILCPPAQSGRHEH